MRVAGWTEYTGLMTTTSPPATKQDVEEIVGRVVSDVVGNIVSDAMQTISDHIDEKFAEVDRRFDRLEDKMETTIARVDHHDIDIRELKRRAA